MRSDIAAGWVANLRSGKYEQGNSRLASISVSGTKFCCLGVLCEMAIQEGVIPPGIAFKDIYWHEPCLIYGQRAYTGLPKEVMEWAGIKTSSADFGKTDDKRNSLMTLNDDGSSFEEIADVIEAHTEEL